MTKDKPKSKTKSTNEDVMQHIVELGERVDYIVETLKAHAESVNAHQSLLDKIRTRMGI